MTMRQEVTGFLDGLIIGFLVASILTYLFLYTNFIPSYSTLVALFAGGCVSGLFARGTFKGGVTAFFSGFFAVLLFIITQAILRLDYSFTHYQVLLVLASAVCGGILGGFITRPTLVIVTPSTSKETQKVYVCQNCGKEVPTKTNFCPECGKRMGKTPLAEKLKTTRKGGERQ